MKQTKSELLQGTLDLLILRTLAAGDMHGWGIAQRLQISQDVLQVNQGSLYPALYRLEQQGWIGASWGDTENNRRAKYYSLTKSGRKQLAEETASWERIATVREGLTPVAIGLAGGLIAAPAMTRVSRQLLFGIEPTDPLTYAAALAALAAAATIACLIAARHAAAVDPLSALRADS